jgi:hypothetical protein
MKEPFEKRMEKKVVNEEDAVMLLFTASDGGTSGRVIHHIAPVSNVIAVEGKITSLAREQVLQAMVQKLIVLS